MLSKEADGQAGPSPRSMPAAPILGVQVVLGERVAEVVLDAGAAGHERAPKRGASDVVRGVRPASLARACDAVEAGVTRVRRQPGVVWVLLVVRHDPLLPGARRLVDPLQHGAVRRVPSRLERDAGERGALAEQGPVAAPLLPGPGVQHDEVAVWIGVPDVPRHRTMLLRRLRVLLAEIPVERELVAEAGDQLAQVEPALDAELAAIERRRHRTRAVAEDVVVVLRLLEFEVEVEADSLRVIEHDAPLVQLRHVEVQRIVALDVWPDV